MDDVYDLVVIGAGAAGLTAAGFGGKINAKVAIIEREKLGGDCTWVGCVPSKALLKVGKVAQTIRTADHYGITTTPPQINMHGVRNYIKQVIDDIYQHETPQVFSNGYNVEVIIGEARFADANTIQVNGRHLKAKKIIVATGARPTIPPIEGLDRVPYKTNLNIFDNDRLPQHLLIVGAGPIGIEMAQAHIRLGAKVTVIDQAILPHDEPEVATVIRPILEAEGMHFEMGLVNAIRMVDDRIIATLDNGIEINGDMLLIAVGRSPNVDEMGLEAAGVEFNQDGIFVDTHLQTNVPHIYAVGDCTTGPKFTHYAGFQGSVAARNALLPVVNSKGHMQNLPWVTYVDPEVAHVGLTEAQARIKYGDKVKVYHFSMDKGDRAVTENDVSGFIKIIYKGSSDLLGTTIVAQRAGEMIVEFSYVLDKKLSLRDIVDVTHAYPTYSDIVRKAVSNLMIDELFKGMSGRVINTVSHVLF